MRAKIILLRAKGLNEAAVARDLHLSITSVSKWSRRFEQAGLDGLREKGGRGRKPWLPDEKVQQVIARVTQPPAGRTRWSVRTMAEAVGISPHAVHTIWKRTDLKPHLTRTFKISTDPQFEQKFWDVIGRYFYPPVPLRTGWTAQRV